MGVSTLLIILTLRKDKSFAYDLFDQAGRVNGRVVLLLRSIERKPEPDLICEKPLSHCLADQGGGHSKGV